MLLICESLRIAMTITKLVYKIETLVSRRQIFMVLPQREKHLRGKTVCSLPLPHPPVMSLKGNCAPVHVPQAA